MLNLLLKAIRENDIITVRRIISRYLQLGIDIESALNRNYGPNQGFREQGISGIPLHIATAMNNPDMVLFFLEHKANPNKLGYFDRSALKIALKPVENADAETLEKKLKIIGLLCLNHAEMSSDELNIQTNIVVEMLAKKQHARDQHIDCQIKILERVYFETIFIKLETHILTNNFEETKNYLDQRYFTLTHPYIKDKVLCQFDLHAILKDVNHPYYGDLVLQASQLENADILSYLQRVVGCSMAAHDHHRNTTMHYAAERGRLRILQYLVEELHIDIQQQNNDGETAMHFAAFYGHLEVLKYFASTLRPSVSVWDRKDNIGNTPLDYLAAEPRKEVQSLLDLRVRGNFIHFALGKQARVGKDSAVKILVDDVIGIIYENVVKPHPTFRP